MERKLYGVYFRGCVFNMKWRNKGKELNQYGVNVCSVYDGHSGIVVFGAGFIGSRICRILKTFSMFDGYIDNNTVKQELGFEDEKVYSVEEMVDKNYFIVVAGKDSHMTEMVNQLRKFGLQIDNDFILYDEFETRWFPTLMFYKFDRLYTNLAQICVTERCTLKCKKCAHACHLVDINSEDMAIEKAKESADSFFKAFDFVGEFVLIGGEPFLYKQLDEIIEYIGEKYRSQIHLFTITTNGTIIPNNSTIELCKKYNVTIRVSDYSDSISKLKQQYEKLYKILEELDCIVWETDKEASWFDYGFFDVVTEDTDTMRENFDKCKATCREVNGNKYYYCVMAHTVAKNSGLNIGLEEYFSLDDNFNRKELLEFEVGYSDKGYLEMCGRCRGKAASKYLIPAAEQVER